MGKRRWAGLAGLLVGTLAFVPIGASPSHAATAPATATTLHVVDGLSSRAVACASATRCISVGSTTVISDDGGLSWRLAAQPISTPPGAAGAGYGPYLETMACATTSLCLAAAYEYYQNYSSTAILVWRTNDGGDTWSFVNALNDAPGGLNRLTMGCPSAKRCIVQGDGVMETTNDGGSTWTASTSTLRAVRCDRTLAARCTAASQDTTTMYSSDSGATWHKATVSVKVRLLMAPVCPSATLCLASAQDGTRSRKFWALRSTNGGRSYTATPLTGIAFGHDIGCVSPTQCVMFGIVFNQNRTVVERTTNGGKSWQPAAAPTATPGQFTCTAARCIFAARSALTNPPSSFGPIATTEDVGLSWHTRMASATDDEITVHCTSSNTCIAAGYDGVSTSTDFGNSWTFRGAPEDGHSIACISAAHCFMIAGSTDGYDATQTVYETLDGGATWNTDFSRVNGQASAIACPSTTRCIAQFNGSPVGEVPYSQFDWNPTTGWSPVTDGSTPFHTKGVLVCVSSRCYGMDDASVPNIYASSDQGATWKPVTPPYHTTVFDLSCVDALHCVGVGQQSTVFTPRIISTADGGASWSYDTSPPVAAYGVTCNTVGHCLVFGNGVAESTDGGMTWATVAVPGFAYVNDAQCGATSCVTVGDITLHS